MIKQAQKISSFQDQVQAFRSLACSELRDIISKSSRAASGQFDANRMERILLRLSTLKKVDVSVMEELFFNDAIGNVKIDSIIPSIIKSSSLTSSSTENKSATSTPKNSQQGEAAFDYSSSDHPNHENHLIEEEEEEYDEGDLILDNESLSHNQEEQHHQNQHDDHLNLANQHMNEDDLLMDEYEDEDDEANEDEE